MATKTVQDSSLTSVADAIRVKAEISGTLEFPDEFVSAIQNISTGITPSGTKTITENGTYDVTNFASADVNVSGGGGDTSVTPKEVNFYDYDGTVTNAYTASEFAALSAMPVNPSHDGLTAQGWNWSLADAKAYVAKYGKLNIGQMYVTTSGYTEIDIQLSKGRNKPYLGLCPNGMARINWGDGSAENTLYGNSLSTLKSVQHVYPDTGERFTIKVSMDYGTGVAFKGSSTSNTGSQLLYNGSTGTSNGQSSYQNAVKAVRCGADVKEIGSDAFMNCYSLKSVTIPKNVTSISSEAFTSCVTLTSLTIPDSVTSIGSDVFKACSALSSVMLPNTINIFNSSLFNACYVLTSLTIPDGITSISSNAIYYCVTLTSLTIPDSVTSIGGSALRYCTSLSDLTFKSATPPLASSNAFANLPSNLVVYVPAGTLAAYKAASNYSPIADKMVEMAA